MTDRLPSGVLVATCTPITPDGRPDLARLVAHAGRLRAEGCAGMLVGGSTGEGQALSLDERRETLARLAGEFTDWTILAATGTPNIADTASLTRHALEIGATPVVMPPAVTGRADDDGVIEWFLRVVEQTRRPDCAIVLYNLPELNGVQLSATLVERLVMRAGSAIVALKDSSSDRSYLLEMRARVPELPLYVGHEPVLVDALGMGAAGALCGMANVIAPLLVATAEATLTGAEPRAAAGQAAITRAWRLLNHNKPFPSAFKALLAVRDEDPGWLRTMPPLRAMDADDARALAGQFTEALRPEAE